MARYVLLEIEDNKATDEFVQAFNDGKIYVSVPAAEEGHYNVLGITELTDKKFRAVGVYMKPTLACDCGGKPGGVRGMFTRGISYGIYVHSACAKASAIDIEKFGKLLPFGYNLLVPEKDNPNRVFGPLDIDGNIQPGTRGVEQGKVPNPNDATYRGKRK